MEQGVITESQSPWWSPIIAVPKPDGTLCLGTDFLKLNAISQFDASHIIGKQAPTGDWPSKIYLDAQPGKGYWQIPLKPEKQVKAAFGIPWGLYEFKRMLFGLNGAVATFQWLIDWVLAPHQSYTLACIDDIIIYTEGWDQHVKTLRVVLQDLR